MIETTQTTLQKALTALEEQRSRTESEIQVIKRALAAIGLRNPKLLTRKHRKPMTAAERKEVAKRMKAYWAKRRAKTASPATTKTPSPLP